MLSQRRARGRSALPSNQRATLCAANPQTRVASLFQGWVWPQAEGKRMSLIQEDVDQERKSVSGQNLNSVRGGTEASRDLKEKALNQTANRQMQELKEPGGWR